MKGDEKYKIPYINILTAILKYRVVEKSISVRSFFLIKALENPESMTDCDIAMNIASMAIMPYSLGDNIRAITKPITKLTPAVANRSIPLHAIPFKVFPFNYSDIILGFAL